MSALTSIVVTGSNQGLGFCIVQQLLTQADNLLIYAAARTLQKAEEAVGKLDATPGKRSSNRVQAVTIDLTSDESITTTAASLPALDILVNNAGMYAKEDYTSPQAVRQTLTQIYDTNLFGTMALSVALLPKLLEKREARRVRPAIINVTSGLASVTNMIDSASPQYHSKEVFYASSKTALNVFTIHAAKQHPEIRIVGVAPGHTATALNGFNAPQSVEVGAQYIVDAILDAQGPSGVYLQRNKQHGW